MINNWRHGTFFGTSQDSVSVTLGLVGTTFLKAILYDPVTSSNSGNPTMVEFYDLPSTTISSVVVLRLLNSFDIM